MTLMPHYIFFEVFDNWLINFKSWKERGGNFAVSSCDNAEEASSLEGQRRERELGKCQK